MRSRQSRHQADAEAPGQRRADHARARGFARATATSEATGNFELRSPSFMESLVSHYVLGRRQTGRRSRRHEGRHARPWFGKVRDFALYGETTGETDEFGLPVRYNWAAEYRGRRWWSMATRQCRKPEWLNRTINIDTGCVFGGKPDGTSLSRKGTCIIAARATYAEPVRPFIAVVESAPSLTAQQAHDDVLDIDDVIGKRIITTRLQHNVTIREENATAALEVMSRFAANPKWLIYLPPTMSPTETTDAAGTAGTSSRSICLLSRARCPQRHLRRKAYGLARRRHRLPRRRCGSTAFRCRRGRHRDLLHAHRKTILR